MKYLFILLIIVLGGSGCSSDHSESEQERVEGEIERLLHDKMQGSPVPGIQIAVYNPEWAKMIQISKGVKDLNHQRALTNLTKIKVGSITKSFTGIAILLLQQRGIIDLDQPLSNYISVNHLKYGNISVRKLLNMGSGLRGYINDDKDDLIIDTVLEDSDHSYTPEELVNYGFELTDKDGEILENTFHYNNTNYILLGMIIEAVTQKSYAAFIQDDLLNPLELNNSFVPDNNDFSDQVSKGYHFYQGVRTDCSNIDLSYVWSAGGVISTATDLCKWIDAVGTGKIISGVTADYIYQGQKVEEDLSYTSGLINEKDKLWHNGTVLGYHGEMVFLKKRKISIAVLSNGTVGDGADIVKELIDEISDLVEKED